MLGAYKKHIGRVYYIDMGIIKADYTFLHANAKAREKHRKLKRLDPFAHCIGAHRKYDTPESLQRHIDGYFRSCMSPARDKNGELILDEKGNKIMVQSKPYTVSGMARYLGITTSTLKSYKVKSLAGLIPPEYAEIIISARQKIEEFAECQLYTKDGNKGGQFVLQAAFGWQTKKEQSERAIAQQKQQLLLREFELKKQMMDLGNNNEDMALEVKIVNATKDKGDTNED